MLKKLFDFDEVCLEGPVVEEERGVSPGGQIFELSRLPGENDEGGKVFFRAALETNDFTQAVGSVLRKHWSPGSG